ncbi:MAG: hypothetical protein GY913_14045 [Proteobacteria bacterium]|nr:hypothetical protein [Pseudomonadota bacterium]MCP4918030.1 hypothetical protein [Pseudomonadota bacterium]
MILIGAALAATPLIPPDQGEDDRFGVAVSHLGDTLVIGAIFQDGDVEDAGAVWLLTEETWTRVDPGDGRAVGLGEPIVPTGDGALWIGRLRDTTRAGEVTRWTPGGTGEVFASPEPQDGAYFGVSIAAGADVDGDGLPDALFGEPGRDDAGGAWLLSADEWTWIEPPEPQDHGLFGNEVALVPDLDGDGLDERLVGAPNQDRHAQDSRVGAAWLGQTRLQPDDAASGFGYSMSRAGDIDGDGYADALISARGHDGGVVSGGYTGAVYPLSGGVEPALGLPLTPAYEAPDLWFGYSLAPLGDRDGDGVDDVAIGAYDATNAQGFAWVFTGSPDGLQEHEALWHDELGRGDRFGLAITGVGDLDGDGLADILVGAPEEAPSGRAHLFLSGPEDTGSPDSPTDSPADSTDDTGAPSPAPGCGCSSTGHAMLLPLALLGLSRRRRAG